MLIRLSHLPSSYLSEKRSLLKERWNSLSSSYLSEKDHSWRSVETPYHRVICLKKITVRGALKFPAIELFVCKEITLKGVLKFPVIKHWNIEFYIIKLFICKWSLTRKGLHPLPTIYSYMCFKNITFMTVLKFPFIEFVFCIIYLLSRVRWGSLLSREKR